MTTMWLFERTSRDQSISLLILTSSFLLPISLLHCPSEDVCFTLDTKDLDKLPKAAAVYQLPDLSAIGEAGVVKLVVRDKKNDTSNDFSDCGW